MLKERLNSFQKEKSLPELFQDHLYRECIQLAMKSKGDRERYGSLIVDHSGEIIGQGYNRAIAHPSFGKLDRVISQGYANHAEIEALNDALLSGYDPTGSVLFVAGYLPKEDNKLFLKEKFTCTKCPPKLMEYGVAYVAVPSLSGWKFISSAAAYEQGQLFVGNDTDSIHDQRLHSAQGFYSLNDLFPRDSS